MTFNASLDKLAKGITIAVTVLFVVIAASQLFLFNLNGEWTAIIVVLFLAVAYTASYFFRTICYNIDENEIIIHRPLKDVVIERRQIKSAQLICETDLKNTIRTFGVGGLFGYYGQFANAQLGCMTWYATRRDKPILIETSTGKKFILTPDEPEVFLQQLHY